MDSVLTKPQDEQTEDREYAAITGDQLNSQQQRRPLDPNGRRRTIASFCDVLAITDSKSTSESGPQVAVVVAEAIQ